MAIPFFGFDRLRSIKVTPVISTSAYSANDAVGAKIKFPAASLLPAGGFYILGVKFWDDVQVKAALNLYLFSEDPGSLAADNAAFALTDAQSDLLIPGGDPISSSTYVAVPTTSAWYSSILATPIPVKLSKGRDLWGQLMCTGTPTFASTTALKVTLLVAQARNFN